jgi:hypothetical protein
MSREFLTMNEAAVAIGLSRRSLSSLLKKHPHYLLGGKGKQFYPNDIEALKQARREETQCRITSTNGQALTAGGYLSKSRVVSGYGEVLEQLTGKSQKRLLNPSKGQSGTAQSTVIPIHSHSPRPS